jgi:tetratricopeptide (TPR) repeat protein
VRRGIAVVCLLLAACATPPPQIPPPEFLLNDSLFAPPSQQVSTDDLFALSEPMKVYLRTQINREVRIRGPQQALIYALYEKDHLKLQYDASATRNAAQAFEARAGNCLSLVILTTAFAKELGLKVRYQSAYLEETWSRAGDLLVRSGHVNVTLDRRLADAGSVMGPDGGAMTIDFLPAEDLRGLRARDVAEETIVAMYMNNKAVEALADGQLEDAYAWSRAAIRYNPHFLSSYNTLGVVYMRRGELGWAEKAFNYVLEREPTHVRAMANLLHALSRLGRESEAAALSRRLAQIEPIAPFHYFNLGRLAMEQENFRLARDLFAKEVARADYHAEFHFWLALANYKLGEIEPAHKHLSLAIQNSVTRKDHDLYAAKLAWLQRNAQSRN